jgi:predicted permease
MRKEITPDWDEYQDRRSYWVMLVGRRKPGITLEQAAAQINVAYRAQLEQDVPLLNLRGREPNLVEQFRAKRIILKPGPRARGGLTIEYSRPLLLLMGMTALVLLICCANVASLQLARGAARVREMALRQAVGASPRRLLRQLLTESCLISFAGGVLGVGVAYSIARTMLATIPAVLTWRGFPTPSIDLRVLLFSVGLSVFTGILFGIFPSLKASRPDLATSLKEQTAQSTSSGAAGLFRKVLVSAQVGMSVLLLITATLFGRTLLNLARMDLGLQTDHLLTFSIDPKRNRYEDQSALSFYEGLTEQLRALPGVKTLSSAWVPVVADYADTESISVDGAGSGAATTGEASYNGVGVDYFRTMGIQLVSGREFTPSDTRSAPKVAIVNEAFARHFFGSENPLGHRMTHGFSDWSSDTEIGPGGRPTTDIEIVGVVKNAKYTSVRDTVPHLFYVPYAQYQQQRELHFYLRTTSEPQQLAPLVRREVASLDSNLPIGSLKTMEAQIDENLFSERLLSGLTSLFAGLALLLSLIGLYGVLAYSVAQRTHEIGIRIALGAQPGRIARMVLAQGLRLAFTGVVIGLASSFVLTRLIASLLYGVSPTDPVTFSVVVLLLLVVAALASYLPARRAARLDPIQALRTE